MTIAIPIITEFNGAGIDKAVKEFKNLETNGEKAQFAIKKAAVPAGIAIAALAAGLVDCAKAAIEDQAAANLLAIALGKSTTATDEAIKANGQFIDSLMLSTNTADDELRPAMARLSRSTGDVTKAQELLALAVDISKGSGKSLETVTAALAKGYDGNTNALGKLGLGLDQGLIKSKDFGAIQEKLTENFGGFGKAAGDTTEGQLARFTLLPVLDAVLPLINNFAKWAQDNPQFFTIMAAALAGIAAAIVAINIAMSINPITAIAIGIGLVVAAVVIAYKKFEAFRDIVDTIFGGIRWWVMNVTVPIFKVLYETAKWAFTNIAKLWNNTLGGFSFTIPEWVKYTGVAGALLAGKSFSIPSIGGGGGDGGGFTTAREFEESQRGALAIPGALTAPTVTTAAPGRLQNSEPPVSAMPTGTGSNAMAGGLAGIDFSNTTFNIDAGLISSPATVGQDIIDAILAAQRNSGVVFAPASGL
jgi:prepilin signal peptidase PulO-like enzyme (type II secretory pathway)